MPTVVFVVTRHVSHLNATFGLARGLTARGAHPLYAGPPELAEPLREQGYELVPAAALADPLAGGHGGRDRVVTAQRELEGLLGYARPDLLVFDPFALLSYPLVAPLGIPVAALSTKPLLRHGALTPPYTSGLIPGAGRSAHALVRLAWAAQWTRHWVARAGAGAGRVRGRAAPRVVMSEMSRASGFDWRRRWVTRPFPFDVRFAGVPELVLTVPDFELATGRPPTDARYLGPCLDLERREPALERDVLDGARGLRVAYCAVGSRGRDGEPRTARFLDQVVAAFAGREGWRLVLATGSDALARRLDAAAPNVAARRWLPQLAVLRRADLMIGHGGHNSVKECIALGVPMLLFPMGADQPGVAARVVRHGLGARGRVGRASAAGIAATAERLVADRSVAAALERMGHAFRRYDHAGVGTSTLLELAGGSVEQVPEAIR